MQKQLTELYQELESLSHQGLSTHARREGTRKAFEALELALDPYAEKALAPMLHEECVRLKLYRSEKHAFEILMLLWAPSASTPLHDHNGVWGVERVLKGHFLVQEFQSSSVEERGIQSLSFLKDTKLHPGDIEETGYPESLHIFRNLSNSEFGITLHFYETPLSECRVFTPLHGSKFRVSRKEVSAVPAPF